MIYFSYIDRDCKLEEKYIRKYDEKKTYEPNVLVTYNNETCWIQQSGKKFKDKNEKDPIYIPVSEMLSHSKGFLALDSKYNFLWACNKNHEEKDIEYILLIK